MRVLYVAAPGVGHVHPAIPLARALADAGHGVTLATSESLRDSVADLAPWEFVPVGDAVVEGDVEDRALFLGRDWPRSCVDQACEVARGSDVFVSGPWDPVGAIVSAKTGVPRAVLGYAVRPAVLPRVRMNTDYCALLRGKGSETMEEFGVAARSSFPCSFVGGEATTIDITPPMLHPWPPELIALDAHSFRHETVTSMYPGAELADVVVCFGSILEVADDAVESIRHECERRKLSLLVVRSGELIDLRRSLAGAKLLVHHGGWGTMMSAIVEGVPQIVAATGGEQLMNGAQVMQQGAGVCVNIAHSSWSGAFERALSCKTGAELLRDRVLELPDIDGAVGVLEGMA